MRVVIHSRRLPLLLAPVGLVIVAAGFALLFAGDDEVTPVAAVNRAVGGSFIACGLIAWWRRPGNGTGALMTLTGFLYALPELMHESGSDLLYTLGEAIANAWIVAFAALVLAFPGGHVTARLDRALIAALFAGLVVVQAIWMLFRPSPAGWENVMAVWPDAGAAETIDTLQRSFNTTVVAVVSLVGAARWARAAPALRRLLLPTLAGSVALLVLVVQSYYQLLFGDIIRPTQDIAVLVLVSVPLAFLFGLLRAQLARAGIARLVLELQQAPDSRRLGELLGRALGDPSLELALWLRGFDTYVDAHGSPVVLPAPGSGRAATPIDHDGEHVAALIHDAALIHEPDLLEIVSAAAFVAIDRQRLQEELRSQVQELASSRARLVEAGDQARRKIERDLHDGAQQRLVALAIALRLTEDRVRADPEAATALAAARRELAESLDELRELARGIHPAVLEHGLEAALESLATRSPTPVTLDFGLDERLPGPVELAAYFVACEALANTGKYARASSARVRVAQSDGIVRIEVADDGVGGADGAQGSGLRGLGDRVEALGGRLSVSSPAGQGTVVTAQLPCEQPAASA